MDFDNFYLKGRGIVDVWIGGSRDLSILMRFLSLKSSTFHKILYFCVPKDGVNASAFSCMSSSGDRTFSFARQISQSPFLHQRNDQWRSILLSNFSFYRLVSAFRRRTRTTEGMKFFIIISIDPIIYSKQFGLHYKFKKKLQGRECLRFQLYEQPRRPDFQFCAPNLAKSFPPPEERSMEIDTLVEFFILSLSHHRKNVEVFSFFFKKEKTSTFSKNAKNYQNQ